MDIRLTDLVSGVKALDAPNGFPRESYPPQGWVRVVFKSGAEIEVPSNEDEFRKAKQALEDGDDFRPSVKPEGIATDDGHTIPVGAYDALWSGYVAEIALDGKKHKIRTETGIRGMNVPATVEIRGGKAHATAK